MQNIKLCNKCGAEKIGKYCTPCRNEHSKEYMRKKREQNPVMCKICNVNKIATRSSMCVSCKNEYDRKRYHKAREIDPALARSLLVQYIQAWESKPKSLIDFELIYMDCCKLIGHDRKKLRKKQICS